MAETRDIKYVNRNFSDFRSRLIDFAKNYFPDTYNDFSPASPGMMFIEMAAYVGDVLSFYQDYQLQETIVQYAKDPSNLYSLAYMMGYRPKVTGVSEVEIEVSQTVDSIVGLYTPDYSQAAFIQPNAQIRSSDVSSTIFTIPNSIDFRVSSSYSPTVAVVSAMAASNPSEYTLKKTVKAFSGEVKSISYSITDLEKFRTISIEDINIVRILDIVDEDGNTWTEVPFLGQETIFIEEENAGSDFYTVPYSLRLQKVPRRFVTRFTSEGVLQIQFGSGVGGSDDSEFIPNPMNVGLGTAADSSYSGSLARLDFAYDPSNFLFSNAYGLAPSSDLTIRYIVGGGTSANVPANSVTIQYAVDSTNTVYFTNPSASYGGRDGDTVEEIRQNAMRAFAEQGRAVTLADYTVRCLSLPPRFGSIAKVFVTQDQNTNSNYIDNIVDNNPLSLSIYTLAYDIDKKLTTSPSGLKSNLKNYLSQYMMLTDSLNIKDAFIVNIGIKYDIILRPNFVGRDVLKRCSDELIEYFNIEKWSINQPINISKLYTLLDRIKGVQTVQKIEILNKQGGNYSQYAYDIKGATRNNIVYPSYDPCIFEIKYPLLDIEGRITSL